MICSESEVEVKGYGTNSDMLVSRVGICLLVLYVACFGPRAPFF